MKLILLIAIVLGGSFQNSPLVLTMRLAEGNCLKESDPNDCFGCGDCSIYCLIENEFSIHASSFLPDQDTCTFQPSQVDDYCLRKPWITGNPTSAGEWLEFKFDRRDFSKSSVTVDGLYIFNGNGESTKQWNAYSRVKNLRMIVNGKEFAQIELHDARAMQSTEFPELAFKDIQPIRFEIADYFSGDQYEQIAVSELRFSGKHHH